MLNAYGFDYKYLKLILSFPSNTKYRKKINSSFSEREHLLIVVPQGSVLGPLSFNIYMCNPFPFMAESNVVNSADDTTLYGCEKKLESESFILFEWFRDNYLRTNSGKSHIMFTKYNGLKINVKGSLRSIEKLVKLLGVTVDNKLSF